MALIDEISYQELSFVLSVVYLVTATCYFVSCFKLFRQDRNLSEPEKRLCLQVLTLATIFWPIVLPLSSLEKRMFASPFESFF
jgi:hypothetical protein